MGKYSFSSSVDSPVVIFGNVVKRFGGGNDVEKVKDEVGTVDVMAGTYDAVVAPLTVFPRERDIFLGLSDGGADLRSAYGSE